MIHQFPLKKLHGYVFFTLLVFLVVQSLKFFSIAGPNWIFHHLNDFLVIPMVATLSLHGVWFIKKDMMLRLNLFTILSLVVLYALVFEYVLPFQSYRYTGDVLDVVCYVAGGIVFYIFQKMK